MLILSQLNLVVEVLAEVLAEVEVEVGVDFDENSIEHLPETKTQ